MPKTSVIIVNWNGIGYLPACLDALAAQTHPADEVIVIDNGSNDGSAQLVETAYPWVQLVRAGGNIGFAAGCNLGVSLARGEFVAILNPDTRAEPAWLESLLAPMAADNMVGMCASLMLFVDRPELINSAGIALDVLGIAWDRLGGRPVGEGSQRCEVFGPCGGAALYRRSLFLELGGFDEDFFMYLEDVDLAWRARARGWRCWYVPEARVYHLHSAAAVEGSAFKNHLKARNRVWLVAKNYPRSQLVKWILPMILYDLSAVLFSLARGDVAPLLGRAEAIRRLRHLLDSRHRHSDSQSWRRVRSQMFGLQCPFTIYRRFAHLN